MPSLPGSQALCGPFSCNDFPSFQAAVEHIESQFRGVLPDTACRIVHIITSLTCKFNKRWRRVTLRLLLRGLPKDERTGYSGFAPLDVSERTLVTHFALLRRVGILITNDKGQVAIDYSKTAVDLIEDEDVMKSVRRNNSHNPTMRNEEGIISWAVRKAEWLLRSRNRDTSETTDGRESPASISRTSCDSCQTSTPCEQSSTTSLDEVTQDTSYSASAATAGGGISWQRACGTRFPSTRSYSFFYRTEYPSQDKSFEGNVRGMLMKTKEMLLASITATVDAGRNRLQAKRQKRGTVADLCNLFEDAWRKGQHERDSTVLASRLVARDRALLKSQIIYPARELGIDVADFANYCAANWDGIGATYFQKAKSYPKAPAFAWFIRCLETYMRAYSERETVELLSATPTPKHDLQVTTKKYAANTGYASPAEHIADLQAQLREAHRKNEEMATGNGLPVEDDPVYARLKKVASRKIVLGSYDDEEPAAPVRKKIKRSRK